jgi:hypothetical protein
MRSFETLYWLGANAEKKQSSYIAYDARFRYALAALVLIEMLLDKNVVWTTQKQLVSVPENPPQDDLLKEIREICTIPNKIKWYWITGKKQEKAVSIKDWFSVMVGGTIPKFLDRVKARLSEKDILQTHQKRFLGLIKYKTTHIISDTNRQIFQKKLQNIAEGLIKPTLQEFILLKVIKACKIHAIACTYTKTKDLTLFSAKLNEWAMRKMDNEAITDFLDTLDLERSLEDLTDMLDGLTDMIDSIADAAGDAGGGDGGGGDGGD